MKPIDPLQLQRLVDGELDATQVQSILGDAASLPDQWRDIAIGYIENQLWHRTFQTGEATEVEPRRSELVGGDLADSTTNIETDELDARSGSLNRSKPALRRPFYFSRFTLAASLLVAATIGYMTNQITHRTIPPVRLADNQPQPLADESLARSNLAPSRPAAVPSQPQITQADYHLEVPQDSEPFKDLVGDGSATSIPLYRIGNKRQLNELNERRKEPVLPPEILKRLASSGYQMEQHVEFISGRLANGRSFVVPVRTIRFVPGQ